MNASPRRLALTLALLLLAAAGLSSSQQAAPAPAADPKPFLGDWTGNISIAGMEIEITVHLTLNADKKITGTIDVPQQGAAGLGLAEIKIDAKSIEFTITDIPGEPPLFKAALDATGKKMTGTISQNGMDGTMALAKVEK
jgi:hypothetical protein